MRQIFVESGVRMAASDGAAVWCFDLDLWGVCVQARTADDAVAAWESAHGAAKVVETTKKGIDTGARVAGATAREATEGAEPGRAAHPAGSRPASDPTPAPERPAGPSRPPGSSASEPPKGPGDVS